MVLKNCEDFGRCPSTVACPLSRRSQFGCEAQVALITVPIVFGVGAVSAIFCFWLRRRRATGDAGAEDEVDADPVDVVVGGMSPSGRADYSGNTVD